jgi:hypothetical protein
MHVRTLHFHHSASSTYFDVANRKLLANILALGTKMVKHLGSVAPLEKKRIPLQDQVSWLGII